MRKFLFSSVSRKEYQKLRYREMRGIDLNAPLYCKGIRKHHKSNRITDLSPWEEAFAKGVPWGTRIKAKESQ